MKTKLPTLLFAPPMPPPTPTPTPRLYNLVLSARPPLRTAAAAGLVEPAQLCQPHYIGACHPHPNCPSLLCFPLTGVYSYVPDKLAGLFESLSAVIAAVGEPTAVDVFLVVSGTRGERPVEGVNKPASDWTSAKVSLHSARQSEERQQNKHKTSTTDDHRGPPE